MEVLSEHGVYPDAEDDAFELRLAIRREIDGYLAAQAEWPSEEDVRKACAAHDAYGSGVVETPAMRAALQSVRPPVGVVSDEDVERACRAICARLGHDPDERCRYTGGKLVRDKHGNTYSYWTTYQVDARTVLESYASRHAPTKD
jgi:hypothetical protein